MKIDVIKQGSALLAINDLEADKLSKFKSGEQYTIEIRNQRNYGFHKKVFAFMNYCFEYWVNDNKYMTEQASFDVFRDNLTVMAGYYESYYKIDGSVRVEAKSISYANMNQYEFEQYYSALIQVAMNTIFKNSDEDHYNTLIGFF